MAYDYFCMTCRISFVPEKYIEGILNCPFCGRRYDIMVLKGNNDAHFNSEQERKRSLYVSNRIIIIPILGAVLVSAFLFLLSNNYIPVTTNEFPYYFAGLGLLLVTSVLSINIIRRISFRNAMKKFPDKK